MSRFVMSPNLRENIEDIRQSQARPLLGIRLTLHTPDGVIETTTFTVGNL